MYTDYYVAKDLHTNPPPPEPKPDRVETFFDTTNLEDTINNNLKNLIEASKQPKLLQSQEAYIFWFLQHL